MLPPGLSTMASTPVSVRTVGVVRFCSYGRWNSVRPAVYRLFWKRNRQVPDLWARSGFRGHWGKAVDGQLHYREFRAEFRRETQHTTCRAGGVYTPSKWE